MLSAAFREANAAARGRAARRNEAKHLETAQGTAESLTAADRLGGTRECVRGQQREDRDGGTAENGRAARARGVEAPTELGVGVLAARVERVAAVSAMPLVAFAATPAQMTQNRPGVPDRRSMQATRPVA